MGEPDVLRAQVTRARIQDASYPDNEGVQLPTWYIMLRPSHLMNEEREVGEHEEVTYAVCQSA